MFDPLSDFAHWMNGVMDCSPPRLAKVLSTGTDQKLAKKGSILWFEVIQQ